MSSSDLITKEVAAGQGVRLAQIARRVPSCRKNRPTNPSTIWRWVRQGALALDGVRVFLEATRTPAGWVTTENAVARFLSRLTQAANSAEIPAPEVLQQKSGQAARKAALELEKLGV